MDQQSQEEWTEQEVPRLHILSYTGTEDCVQDESNEIVGSLGVTEVLQGSHGARREH